MIKIMSVKILNDDEFNNLVLKNNEYGYKQIGGENNYLYEYLKYKLKYLKLKYDTFDNNNA